MADVKVVRSTQNAGDGSLVDELRKQHNALDAAFRAVLAKLDADSGVGDTNYAALHGAVNTVSYK